MPLVQFETMTWLLVGDRVVGCRGFSAGHEIIVMPVGNRWVSTDVGQFQPQRVIAVLRVHTGYLCGDDVVRAVGAKGRSRPLEGNPLGIATEP